MPSCTGTRPWLSCPVCRVTHGECRGRAQAGDTNRNHLEVILAASSNRVTADIATGVALLVAGGLLITGGLVWARGYRQLVSRYYAQVIRVWDKIPGVGTVYKKIVPFSQFRYLGSIVAIVIGLLLCIVGIGSLIVA
jgi:hypothetical protein